MYHVQYKIGNTYKSIPSGDAALDRTGEHRKVHDWTLYVDVIESNPDYIDIVKFHMNSTSFSPPYFTCHCPIPIKQTDGSTIWRFSTRQQTYGNLGTVSVIVRGRGGTNRVNPYNLSFVQGGGMLDETFVLNEGRKLRPFKPRKMWQNHFGVELELTASSREVNLNDVARTISSKSGERVRVYTNYSEGKKTNNQWKLVPDSSITCNASEPNCTKFELVSPILTGGHGLNKCYHVVENGIGSIASIKVNKSMGFHVHVDVTGISLLGLKKICQNFIKYESTMDSFMPPSRRSGSPECERYFKSNKLSILKKKNSNSARHFLIARCKSEEELFELMNPNDDRYHKLNFQNLVTRKQKTIEFRQHSATSEYAKLQNWVRFCMALVENSIRLKSPSPLKENSSINDQFEKLFHHVIKDRYLREFYQQRREELGRRHGHVE